MPAKLSSNEEYALQQTAKALGVKRDSLYNLIQFESGWNPQATNSSSGARGLIQFMPSTAKSMGYSGGIFSTAADSLVNEHSTRVKQLQGPVLNYLSKMKPYSGTDQNLFMAVFYPAYRNVASTTPFPANVIAQNPGVFSPLDYVNKVYRSVGVPAIAGGSMGILLLAGAVATFLLLGRKRRRR